MNAVDVLADFDDLGLPEPYRIKTGDRESSILWERMRRLDAYRMPPLASSIVCLLYTSPSPRDATLSRMPSSA